MEKNRVITFYNENKDKFTTRRQASKYLNEYGSVYKTEKNIPLSYSQRTLVEVSGSPKSSKKVRKIKK